MDKNIFSPFFAKSWVAAVAAGRGTPFFLSYYR
jgi:hypothetical protein